MTESRYLHVLRRTPPTRSCATSAGRRLPRRRAQLYTVETHIRHLAEAHAGEPARRRRRRCSGPTRSGCTSSTRVRERQRRHRGRDGRADAAARRRRHPAGSAPMVEPLAGRIGTLAASTRPFRRPTGPAGPSGSRAADDAAPPAHRADHGRPARRPRAARVRQRGRAMRRTSTGSRARASCSSAPSAPRRCARRRAASLMTGALPRARARYDNAGELPASVPTFAHHLRAAGYRTVLAGKMHFIGPDQLHGFEERLVPDVYPAGFDWVPDWRLADDETTAVVPRPRQRAPRRPGARDAPARLRRRGARAGVPRDRRERRAHRSGRSCSSPRSRIRTTRTRCRPSTGTGTTASRSTRPASPARRDPVDPPTRRLRAMLGSDEAAVTAEQVRARAPGLLRRDLPRRRPRRRASSTRSPSTGSPTTTVILVHLGSRRHAGRARALVQDGALRGLDPRAAARARSRAVRARGASRQPVSLLDLLPTLVELGRRSRRSDAVDGAQPRAGARGRRAAGARRPARVPRRGRARAAGDARPRPAQARPRPRRARPALRPREPIRTSASTSPATPATPRSCSRLRVRLIHRPRSLSSFPRNACPRESGGGNPGWVPPRFREGRISRG